MARRSAPSSSMWVPKAWRRVCGWTSGESPLATAIFFMIRPTLRVVRRPPRWLIRRAGVFLRDSVSTVCRDRMDVRREPLGDGDLLYDSADAACGETSAALVD